MISGYSKHREEEKTRQREEDRVNQWVRMFAVAVYAYCCVLLCVSCVLCFVTQVITAHRRQGEDEKVSKCCLQRVTKNEIIHCHLVFVIVAGHSFSPLCISACSTIESLHLVSCAIDAGLISSRLIVTVDSVHFVPDSQNSLFMSPFVTGTWPFCFTPKIGHSVNGDGVFQYSTWECECVQNG